MIVVLDCIGDPDVLFHISNKRKSLLFSTNLVDNDGNVKICTKGYKHRFDNYA